MQTEANADVLKTAVNLILLETEKQKHTHARTPIHNSRALAARFNMFTAQKQLWSEQLISIGSEFSSIRHSSLEDFYNEIFA